MIYINIWFQIKSKLSLFKYLKFINFPYLLLICIYICNLMNNSIYYNKYKLYFPRMLDNYSLITFFKKIIMKNYILI